VTFMLSAIGTPAMWIPSHPSRDLKGCKESLRSAPTVRTERAGAPSHCQLALGHREC